MPEPRSASWKNWMRWASLHHPAQQHPPGCAGDKAAGRGHGTGLRPHRAAGELRGSGRGGTRQHPAAGAVRVPGAGAGFCPAPLGDHAGTRALAASAGVCSCHAAGRAGVPHEGSAHWNGRPCAGMRCRAALGSGGGRPCRRQCAGERGVKAGDLLSGAQRADRAGHRGRGG